MNIIIVGLYVACQVIANVTAYKPVTVGFVTVPGGVFIYTLTFTLIDVINERLGKKGARQVVYAGFVANFLLAGYSWLVISLPTAPFFQDSAAFSRILGSTPRIVVASLTAYLVSSLIDTEVFAWWRERIGGYKWARVIASNAVSTLVDSVCFISIAFLGVLPVLAMIRGLYIMKMAITIVSVPLIYLARERRQQTMVVTAESYRSQGSVEGKP